MLIRSSRLAALACGAALLALAGCVTPSGQVIAPAPGGGLIVTPPTNTVGQRPINSGIEGIWCFEDRRGRVREREIDVYRNGIVATNARGRQREYRRVGQGRYEELGGDSVYLFRSVRNAVFSRDGTERNAVALYRCG